MYRRLPPKQEWCMLREGSMATGDYYETASDDYTGTSSKGLPVGRTNCLLHEPNLIIAQGKEE